MHWTDALTTSKLIAVLSVLVFVTSSGVAQPKSEPAKDSDAEVAIQKGLKWLALKQRTDGGWGFDGSSKDRYAATGMALLPFLNAGEGPTKAAKYQDAVKKGVDWLVGSVQKDGKIATNMYSHAIATIALCYAYHLSKDVKLLEKATSRCESHHCGTGKEWQLGLFGARRR